MVLQIILGLLVVRYGRMLVKLPDLASSSTDVGEHHSFLPPSDMPIRKWAYAFLIAGVDPRKEGYHGFFYNVLISAELLKKTQADVIVMVQMAKNTADRLTDEEERQLKIQNVKIVYLELPPHQNFYTIQFEKFRILDFTEYSRVIFLDGDVFTFCPMVS